MAVETRASSASKVDESTNSRTLRSSSRLAREKLLRSDTKASPLNVRKSVKRKHKTTVRKSEKSKEESVPGSSRLKKPRMAKLTSKTKEVNNSEVELSKGKTRYNALSYKALFTKKKKKQRTNVEADSVSPTTSKTVDDQSSKASATEDRAQPQLGDDIVLEAGSDNEIVSVSIDKSLVSKRKRIEAGLVDETALVSSKDADISPTDAAAAGEDQSRVKRVSNDFAGGLKRQRVNDEGKQQEVCYLNIESDWGDACHKSKLDGSNPSEVEVIIIDKSIEPDWLQNSQSNLHCDLKPKIASLCEVLRFPDDVKCIVVSFLDYIVNNQYHQLASKRESGLQAFQIALCWTAASLLKYKIDHMESLGLAKERLNFGCKKEHADFEYSMLRCLKKLFLSHHQRSKYVSDDQLHASPSNRSISSSPKENGDGVQIQQPLELAHQDFSRSIKDIHKKCDKQFRKLVEQQAQQREDLLKKYEDQKAQLEKKQEMEAAVICLYSPDSMRPDKLEFMEAEYAEKFKKLERERVTELKNLEAMQSASRKTLEENKLKWVGGLETWAKEELMPRLPRKDTGQTSGTGVSSDVHPKQVTCQASLTDRGEEETTQMVKSAAEVIHETPSTTVHVESTQGEVTSEPLASTGESERPLTDQQVKDSSLQSRDEEPGSTIPETATITGFGLIDNNADGEIEEGEISDAKEGDGEILSPESERPLTDQLMKHSSLQNQDTGTEKVGLGVLDLPLGVDAGLQGEPVSEIPETDTTTTTCLVGNNADGEIEEGEISGAEEGGGEILSSESERPMTDQQMKDSSLQSQDTGTENVGLGVPDLPLGVDTGLQGEPVSAIPETATTTTTCLVDNNVDGEIEEGEISGTEEGGGEILSAESERPVTKKQMKESYLQSQDTGTENVGLEVLDLCPEVDKLDDQNDGSTEQDVAASSIPSRKDSSKELFATDSPLIQPETSITGVSSSRIDQQDPGRILAGVSNVSTDLADGSSHQEGTVTGVHKEATAEVVGVGVKNLASAEVLEDHNDGILMHDPKAPVTNQSDQSEQIVHSISTPVQDGVVSCVSGSDTNTEVADVADLCIENNGTRVGQESRSSEDTEVHHQDDQSQHIVQTSSAPVSIGVGQAYGSSEDTAVHHQDATAIPLVAETATTARIAMGNSCTKNNISSQNLGASTARRDDGSGESSMTNSTSMQPEVAVSAQSSSSLPNQPVQDELRRQLPASTRANVSETVTAPSTSANRARLPQPAPVYRMPLPFLGPDPLQNELDRVSRVVDQIVNIHEKEKLQLRFDCEKEMEEVVAQIRRKYEAIAKESETEFARNKSKLDAKHYKIRMNKLLADVFRCKCVDSRANKSVGVVQDAAASFMQQFQNLSSQPTQPYTGQRFSTAASRPLQPPPNGLVANHQPTGSPHLSISRAHPVAHRFPTPTHIPQSSRPLNISTLTPTTASSNLHQFGSQFRAPAPHMQAVRAMTSHGLQSHLCPHSVVRPSTVVSITASSPVPPALVNAPAIVPPEVRPNGAQGNSTQQNEVVYLSDDD